MATSRPRQRFSDIVQYIDDIRLFCQDVGREDFGADKEKTYAVQLALLRISEAARKLGEIAPTLEPDIPWKEVQGISAEFSESLFNRPMEEVTHPIRGAF